MLALGAVVLFISHAQQGVGLRKASPRLRCMSAWRVRELNADAEPDPRFDPMEIAGALIAALVGAAALASAASNALTRSPEVRATMAEASAAIMPPSVATPSVAPPWTVAGSTNAIRIGTRVVMSAQTCSATLRTLPSPAPTSFENGSGEVKPWVVSCYQAPTDR